MTLLHVDITTLDDLETMELDASGMLDHVTLLGHEFVSAWERASVLQTPSGPFDSVVIAGVGGSAIAGDYFRGLALLSSPVPIEVVRSATLPAYVGDGTLVIACSYSGNTTEALTCYKEARIRGASVLVISSG
ncbi:MAG TPA: bifunctional phosphoglucose/phosphomannose isomerase, partial [Dehalococcoidia bacterium]|nr:bifunctional phosphoglucose/phosphomannose isomerase [Dehalococcoidia bacterium]